MTILISKLIDDGISLYKVNFDYLLNSLYDYCSFLNQKNQYKDAAYRFSYALKKLPIDTDQLTTDQFIPNFRMMKYNCLMNLAKCKRKLDV